MLFICWTHNDVPSGCPVIDKHGGIFSLENNPENLQSVSYWTRYEDSEYQETSGKYVVHFHPYLFDMQHNYTETWATHYLHAFFIKLPSYLDFYMECYGYIFKQSLLKAATRSGFTEMIIIWRYSSCLNVPSYPVFPMVHSCLAFQWWGVIPMKLLTRRL